MRTLVAAALLAGCGRVAFDEAPCIATDSSCALGVWTPFASGGPDQSTRIEWGSMSATGITHASGGHYDLSWFSFVDGRPRVMYSAEDPELHVYTRAFDGTAWIDAAAPKLLPSFSDRFGADHAATPWTVAYDVGNDTSSFERWDGSTWRASGSLAGDVQVIGHDGAAAIVLRRDSADELAVYRFDGTAFQPMGAQLTAGGGLGTQIVSGPNPIVCWFGGPGFPRDLFLRQWNGASWIELGNSASVGFAVGQSYCTVDETGAPIFVWTDFTGLYVQRWDGTQWAPLFPGSTSSPGLSETPTGDRPTFPSAAVRDGKLLLAWYDEHVEGGGAYYTMYTRDGAFSALSPRERAPFSRLNLGPPAMAIDPAGRLCMAGGAHGRGVLVGCRDQGRWVPFDRDPPAIPGISATAGDALQPTLATARGRIEIAWSEYDGMLTHTFTKQLVEDAWTTRDANDASGTGVSGPLRAEDPAIAIGPDSTVLVWRYGSTLLSRRWNGSAWVDTSPGATDPVTHGVLQQPSSYLSADVHFDDRGQLWLAWTGLCTVYNTYAASLTDATWTIAGRSFCDPGLGPDNGFDPRLASHPTTGLVMVMEGTDIPSTMRSILVTRWDGTAWTGLAGSNLVSGISDGNQNIDGRIAIDSQGRIWVAWSTKVNGRWQIYVKQFDGSAWIDLAGSARGDGLSASSGGALTPAIAIDDLDRPYVFWSDRASGTWEIYGRRWSGFHWQELSGSASGGGISNSSTPSITPEAIVRGTTPCVVWSERDRQDGEIRGRCLSLQN